MFFLPASADSASGLELSGGALAWGFSHVSFRMAASTAPAIGPTQYTCHTVRWDPDETCNIWAGDMGSTFSIGHARSARMDVSRSNVTYLQTQCRFHSLATTAGPKDRAGLKLAPENGYYNGDEEHVVHARARRTATKLRTAATKPMVTAFSRSDPLARRLGWLTAYTTSVMMNVMTSSMPNASPCPAQLGRSTHAQHQPA